MLWVRFHREKGICQMSLPFLFGLVLFASALNVSARTDPERTIQRKTQAIAKSCYWTHGRLGAGNGTPAFRLWKVGTNRLLGIYSGPSVNRIESLDNEGPELPDNLLIKFRPYQNRVYADFEVSPLELEKPHHMQAARIESAKNIVVEKN
jgi:hypothetical protein